MLERKRLYEYDFIVQILLILFCRRTPTDVEPTLWLKHPYRIFRTGHCAVNVRFTLIGNFFLLNLVAIMSCPEKVVFLKRLSRNGSLLSLVLDSCNSCCKNNWNVKEYETSL